MIKIDLYRYQIILTNIHEISELRQFQKMKTDTVKISNYKKRG